MLLVHLDVVTFNTDLFVCGDCVYFALTAFFFPFSTLVQMSLILLHKDAVFHMQWFTNNHSFYKKRKLPVFAETGGYIRSIPIGTYTEVHWFYFLRFPSHRSTFSTTIEPS